MLLVSRWGGSGWVALPGQKEGRVCSSGRQSQGNPHDGPGLPITLQLAHSHAQAGMRVPCSVDRTKCY